MDILSMLKVDHKNARALLRKLLKLADEPTRETRSLTEEFVSEMKLHAHSEAYALYEACKLKSVQLKDFALEGSNEHECLELMLDKLMVTEPGPDGEFKATLLVLKELIQHHAIEEEEQQMFPKIRKAFDLSERKELGAIMEKRKSELKRDLNLEASPESVAIFKKDRKLDSRSVASLKSDASQARSSELRA